jgi:hypothetical protein
MTAMMRTFSDFPCPVPSLVTTERRSLRYFIRFFGITRITGITQESAREHIPTRNHSVRIHAPFLYPGVTNSKLGHLKYQGHGLWKTLWVLGHFGNRLGKRRGGHFLGRQLF